MCRYHSRRKVEPSRTARKSLFETKNLDFKHHKNASNLARKELKQQYEALNRLIEVSVAVATNGLI